MEDWNNINKANQKNNLQVIEKWILGENLA